MWKQKHAAAKHKSVALMQTLPKLNSVNLTMYQPFLFTGTVSLSSESEERQIRILRDTGASHSFILREMLPFSTESYTDTDVVVRGFGMGCVNVPLHHVFLKSDLVTGLVTLGVCLQLPVDGVDLILGNDLAGGQVFPRPLVVHEPSTTGISELDTQFASVFPVCAVTRAQSQKVEDVFDLSDTVLFSQPEKVTNVEPEVVPEETEFPVLMNLTSKIGRSELAAAQNSDSSLATCRDAVVDVTQVSQARIAFRESVQESIGFSPAELVFGHTVRGPLRLLSEQLLSQNSTPIPVLEYVTSVKERLHQACQLAQTHLAESQAKMKTRFDHKSVVREFQPGDLVLVLLPVPGASLQAKFAGPYKVEEKLSDTNYVIRTPDRRRKSRVCHVNMLKSYIARNANADFSVVKPVSTAVVLPVKCPEEDGLVEKNVQVLSAHLQNSVILRDLHLHLSHLTKEHCEAVSDLIAKFPNLFSDVPSQTTVLSHDIDVGDSKPVKQHPYRVNPKKREVMKSEVTYLVKHGLATPSQSPWSSPCILVPKPDSTFRFCTDYRKVNAMTKPDSFPLPRMEDCVDKVGAATYVTKLDLLKGYWQVPLTSRASEISAFVTPDALLQYSVMAFGMRNAPATFQRLMNQVLSGVTNVEVYLDDVVVFF